MPFAISGVKRKPGTSPARAVSDNIKTATAPARGLPLFGRVIIGSFLGFLFIPIALFAYFKNSYFGANPLAADNRERLNSHQVAAFVLTCATIAVLGWVAW